MAITTFIAPHDGEEPTRAEVFPAPRSFFWLPLDGQRHTADIRDRELPNGESISTLCDQDLKRVPAGDLEWLWPTCPACWDAAVARVKQRR